VFGLALCLIPPGCASRPDSASRSHCAPRMAHRLHHTHTPLTLARPPSIPSLSDYASHPHCAPPSPRARCRLQPLTARDAVRVGSSGRGAGLGALGATAIGVALVAEDAARIPAERDTDGDRAQSASTRPCVVSYFCATAHPPSQALTPPAPGPTLRLPHSPAE
jgi:hypothetical protein